MIVVDLHLLRFVGCAMEEKPSHKHDTFAHNPPHQRSEFKDVVEKHIVETFLFASVVIGVCALSMVVFRINRNLRMLATRMSYYDASSLVSRSRSDFARASSRSNCHCTVYVFHFQQGTELIENTRA
jgi:hypothetical protein